MFDVPGRHTFFLAVDSAFQVKPQSTQVATAAFWRTFSDEGKISPGW
jgi:hypothetical protein